MAKEVVKKEVVEKSGADKFLAEMGHTLEKAPMFW
jgi:hypothetical protein